MKYLLITSIFITFVLGSCDPGKQKEDKLSAGITVKWELIENTVSNGQDIFNARFIIENQGDRTLKSNWALFFSTNPRRLRPEDPSSPGVMKHINGDWHKLVPEADFELKPGETIDIPYSAGWCLIKKSNAPKGVYFVFYDDKGNEQKTEKVNCEVLPFVRPEQMTRGRGDLVPVPTPEGRYNDNLKLHLLSKDELTPVLPTPFAVKKYDEKIAVDNNWSIRCDRSLKTEAGLLAKRIEELTGLSLKITSEKKEGKQIVLQVKDIKVNGKKQEAYNLKAGNDEIVILGGDAAGVFYGTQSLIAMIPVNEMDRKPGKFQLDRVEIMDAPRFDYRGIQIDLARNYQNKETILKELDIMSFYKLNTLQLYIADDEGWRLEIPGLPELTGVSGHRQHTKSYHDPVLHPAYGSGPDALNNYGAGYLTKSDFIDVLKYAAERHIHVMPCFNVPGHARGAIKAMEARYLRLMKEGKEQEAEEFRLIDPDDKSVYRSAQAYHDNVVSVVRESTYAFVRKVISEMQKMYVDAGLTLTDIHLGGDEVPEGAWTKSPLALKFQKEHPEYKNARNLQMYLEKRLLGISKDMGFRLSGWEEVVLKKKDDGSYILNEEFTGADIVPFLWNDLYEFGNMDLSYRLANAGFKIVMCPATNFYFDLAYNKDPYENGAYWGGFIDTRKAWTFAPYDIYKTVTHTSYGKEISDKDKERFVRLNTEARKNILGLQAQFWSEDIRGRDVLEYRMFPRLIAFAERAWAKERPWETIEDKQKREQVMDKEYELFANIVAQKELPRLGYLNGGFNRRISLPGAVIKDGKLYANTEFPGLEIRYTTDGSEPDVNSALYDKPVSVSGEVRLKAFDSSGKGSRTVVVKID